MDLLEGEPRLCGETCLISSHDGNEVTGIKVEEVTDIREEEGQQLMTSLVIKAEFEVRCMSVL
jgi:hypothetical protein